MEVPVGFTFLTGVLGAPFCPVSCHMTPEGEDDWIDILDRLGRGIILVLQIGGFLLGLGFGLGSRLLLEFILQR